MELNTLINLSHLNLDWLPQINRHRLRRRRDFRQYTNRFEDIIELILSRLLVNDAKCEKAT